MRVKRREFLKTIGVAGAGLMLFHPVLNAFEKGAEGEILMQDIGKWIPSTCQGCTTWCPIEVFVQNDRAVKVRGNQNSMVNPGFVCPRGHLIPLQMYDPDRIKVPMKRTNPEKGKGVDPKFVPITWEEALDTIADKLLELRANNEPEKFVLMRGRYTPYLTNIFYGNFPKIMGTPNNISHSSICAEAEKMGPFYTEGFFGYRDYDLLNTKYLVLWGVDPARSNRLVPGFINKYGEILDNAKVVCIDPFLTTSASKSAEWLPIKPGEDGALACAFAHEILVAGKWDKTFVGDFKDGVNLFKVGDIVSEDSFTENYTNGIVKWWNIELKDKTAEWAAEITGLNASDIRRIANEMADKAPKTAVWLGPGPVMSPRGTYTSMAIHALNGLLGSVDNEGGTLRQPSVSVGTLPSHTPYMDAIAEAGIKAKKIDQRGTRTLPAMASGKPGSGVVTNNVANAINSSNPYDVKVLIAYWINPNFSCTGAQRWDEALKKVPFFAHIVTNPSEMTQFADIVLPAKFSATECLSIVNSKGNLYSNISIQQPVAKTYFDAKKDETEILWLLSERLKLKGFTNLYDYLHNEFKDPETDAKPTTAEEFALYATKLYAKPSYDKIGGWDKFKEIGVVNYGPYKFKTYWDNFGTVTKKFEFYSETMKKALETHAAKFEATVDEILQDCNYIAKGEQAFVPHYEPPKRWGSTEEYPFTFVEQKSRFNREGRSQNTAWYYEFKRLDPGDNQDGDYVKMNPDDASVNGFKDGDTVKLISETGEIICKVKLWEGIRPGTVSKTYGQGHWAYGRIAADNYKTAKPRGGNNNELLPDDYDRLSGSTCRNGGFTGVKIQKV